MSRLKVMSALFLAYLSVFAAHADGEGRILGQGTRVSIKPVEFQTVFYFDQSYSTFVNGDLASYAPGSAQFAGDILCMFSLKLDPRLPEGFRVTSLSLNGPLDLELTSHADHIATLKSLDPSDRGIYQIRCHQGGVSYAVTDQMFQKAFGENAWINSVVPFGNK